MSLAVSFCYGSAGGILSEQILTETLSNPKLTSVAFLQFGEQAAQPGALL